MQRRGRSRNRNSTTFRRTNTVFFNSIITQTCKEKNNAKGRHPAGDGEELLKLIYVTS